MDFNSDSFDLNEFVDNFDRYERECSTNEYLFIDGNEPVEKYMEMMVVYGD